jgi:hypothetical protein
MGDARWFRAPPEPAHALVSCRRGGRVVASTTVVDYGKLTDGELLEQLRAENEKLPMTKDRDGVSGWVTLLRRGRQTPLTTPT